MDLLGVTALSVEVSAGEASMPSTSLAWCGRPRPFISKISNLVLPSKLSAHAVEWSPAKLLLIGPRTC